MRPLFGSILIGLPLLAGCLGGPGQTGFSFEAVTLQRGAFVMDLPIHVVAVGFDSFSESQLLERLRQPLPPFKLARADKTGDLTPEPLQYRLLYRVHVAPESFAEALFAYAKSVSRKDVADAFLEGYDRAGRNRICPVHDPASLALQLDLSAKRTLLGSHESTCKEIDRIDAAALEGWIADHRAEYGLEFGAPGYTIFLLDSYSNAYLPRDSYHQYEIDDGTSDPYVKNMRAWGGQHDFIYIDTSAGPNPGDVLPWANFSREGQRLAGIGDLPIWSYGKFQRSQLYVNMAQHTYDAARMLWARSPMFPFAYAEKYVLPIYVFVDPNARANPESLLAGIHPMELEMRTETETIRSAFQALAPWAEVDLTVKFVYLPDDDPALAAALFDAKNRYTMGTVDFGVIKKYFREHMDSYAAPVPGARVYPTFAFWLEFPADDLNGFADSDERGNSFAAFLNVADLLLCNRPNHVFCYPDDVLQDEATWWGAWNGILIHELGHSFGLTHSHDTNGIDVDGYVTYERNLLWASTSSIMSNRHSLPGFSAFDRDLLLRAHAVELSLKVIKAGDAAPVPARETALQALNEVRLGRYAGGLALAEEAIKASKIDVGAAQPRVAGEVARYLVQLPGSGAIIGQPPKTLGIPASSIGAWKQLTFVDVPLEIPEGARSVEIEYREANAPSHLHWRSDARILNATGELVAFLNYNAYDRVELANLDRCDAGCRIRIQAYSGINLSYEVAVYAYFE